MLRLFCDERGLTYAVRNLNAPTYELARIHGENFVMIAYPHKTSANNYHIRMRDGGSQDKRAYMEAVAELDKLAGFNCTFQAKHMSTLKHELRKEGNR